MVPLSWADQKLPKQLNPTSKLNIERATAICLKKIQKMNCCLLGISPLCKALGLWLSASHSGFNKNVNQGEGGVHQGMCPKLNCYS